ncbi:MTM1_2 [Blepharisma stoltei]|uniref:Phosphatidylinositol-3-phosphatase n=1 Tax=Blepharisma stoltei TaxID=1481888 RepID=A0AAU9KBH2_9CILI|nr:unnamed protein product [Blepharisma stoltei]
MVTTYFHIPSIYNITHVRAMALASYKSDLVTHLNLKKDQEIQLVEVSDDWSWAVDFTGKSGWVPSTQLRISETPATQSDISRLRLTITLRIGDKLKKIDYLGHPEQTFFTSQEFAAFENVDWSSTLSIVLKDDDNTISVYEEPLASMKDQANEGVYFKTLKSGLKGNFASCLMLIRVSNSLEALQSMNSDYDMPGVAESYVDPELMPGEVIATSAKTQGACGNIILDGMLYLTNARLIFISSSIYSNVLSCPLLCIENTETVQGTFKVMTKDLRAIEYSISSQEQAKIFSEKFGQQIGMFFCISHYLALTNPQPYGWGVYDPEREFMRLGVLESNLFRICELNTDYELCDTYPSILIQPVTVPDTQLEKISKFRSKNRIPTLCWYGKGAGLYRSSQPLVGFFSSRCRDDEDYMLKSRIKYIIDARPKINARANKVSGKGYEHQSHYPHCKIIFANIHNIHKVRESFESLVELFGRDDDFFLMVQNSRWLHYIKAILSAAKIAADLLYYEKASVLVHCSDGWDRTPEITSLAQLLLDPFYRSFHGFQVLLAKEWLAFGHRFRERIQGTEKSPVFIQFLDSIHQVLSQFPNEFQFNSKYLLFLASALYSGKYGTFMSDCEKTSQDFQGRTLSAFSEDSAEFLNSNYSPSQIEILPLKVGLRYMKLWEYHFQWQII